MRFLYGDENLVAKLNAMHGAINAGVVTFKRLTKEDCKESISSKLMDEARVLALYLVKFYAI